VSVCMCEGLKKNQVSHLTGVVSGDEDFSSSWLGFPSETSTYDVSFLGCILDFYYQLLFLILETYAFSIEFSDRFVDHALILPQLLCR